MVRCRGLRRLACLARRLIVSNDSGRLGRRGVRAILLLFLLTCLPRDIAQGLRILRVGHKWRRRRHRPCDDRTGQENASKLAHRKRPPSTAYFPNQLSTAKTLPVTLPWRKSN